MLRIHLNPIVSALAAIIAISVTLSACSVQEHKEGGKKRVSIDTPFASLKVNTDVDPASTGLPVYPGARPKQKGENDSDEKAANVNIQSSVFGLKVAAMEFESDDAPDKVLTFYRDKMKSFGGKFLECRSESGFHYDRHGEDKELTCDSGGQHGNTVELKAGVPENQHIVAVKPEGKGSSFALVWVQTRGHGETL